MLYLYRSITILGNVIHADDIVPYPDIMLLSESDYELYLIFTTL